MKLGQLSLITLLTQCGLFRDFSGRCGLNTGSSIQKPGAKKIRYVVSNELYDKDSEQVIETPCVVVEKTQKSFELWESIDEVPLVFEYAGIYNSNQDPPMSTAQDPLIYLDFSGQNYTFDQDLVAGVGGYRGTIPDNYEGGHVYFNTKQGHFTWEFRTMTHEIGHALGLYHLPSVATMMTCGTAAWSYHEYLYFNLQDRTSLRELWNPTREDHYLVSGGIPSNTAQGHNAFFVYVVDVVSGITFSDISSSTVDQTGYSAFSIAIPREMVQSGELSGRFKVMAKAFDSANFQDPALLAPAWWISNTSSTNDIASATEIVLNDDNSAVSNVYIQPIQSPVPGNFFWGQNTSPSTFVHSFMRAGESGTFRIEYLAGSPSTVTVVGSNPKVSLSSFTPSLQGLITLENTYDLTQTNASDAAEGERLVEVRFAGSGIINYGLIGVAVNKGALPSYLGLNTTADQFSGKIKISPVNPNFWKP